ncbi:hypothetical protein F2Q68_00001422 [Brassica cretica]|uniref:Uncharacterized protein n=1 Tax=Brassica cretica TaxID=69181 RepID=A0A8S9JAU1_BRACR|nr:hypothetical protein F2Q68_00001422 [Brassica cretica]
MIENLQKLLNGNAPGQTTIKPLHPSRTRQQLRTRVTQASQIGKGESFRFNQPPETAESYTTEKHQEMKPHQNQISRRFEQETRSQAYLTRSTKNTYYERHKDGSEESITNSIHLDKERTTQEAQRYATQ